MLHYCQRYQVNSLYKHGLWPLLYSKNSAKEQHKLVKDWKLIKYYKNSVGQDRHHYFSLTWVFQFPDQDTFGYFAHYYHYTYRNLQEYLVAISKVLSKCCKIHILCCSLWNTVRVLTITTTSPLQRWQGHRAEGCDTDSEGASRRTFHFVSLMSLCPLLFWYCLHLCTAPKSFRLLCLSLFSEWVILFFSTAQVFL